MRRALVITVLFILLVPLVSHAEEYKYSISAGVFTKHFDSNNANEDNRLLSFGYKNWFVAWFENSHYQETLFAGYKFQTKKYALKETKWYCRAGIYTGLVYGYGDNLPTNVGGFSPFLLPAGSLGYGRFSFELGVIPLPGSAGLVTGIFKIEF